MPRTSGRASSSAVRKIGSVRSVGSFSVRCRVIVRNDESRILTVTVDALTPESRSRPATPSDRPSSDRSITSRSDESTSNVCSWPIDFAGSRSLTVVGVQPARPVADHRPDLAEAPLEEVLRQRRQVADRPDAVLAQHRRRLRADAPQPRDRQRREELGLGARRDDDQPVRLAEVGGDLGDELRPRDADRDRQPDLVRDCVLDRPARSSHRRRRASATR